VAQPEAIAAPQAVAADPQFAMAHELLAQISLDSAEQVSEQQKAFATRRYASPVDAPPSSGTKMPPNTR